MGNEESGVLVLDDGIEEAAESLSGCCSAAVSKARTSNS
jgi:hypothetical protein